jgi:hypothetical protein
MRGITHPVSIWVIRIGPIFSGLRAGHRIHLLNQFFGRNCSVIHVARGAAWIYDEGRRHTQYPPTAGQVRLSPGIHFHDLHPVSQHPFQAAQLWALKRFAGNAVGRGEIEDGRPARLEKPVIQLKLSCGTGPPGSRQHRRIDQPENDPPGQDQTGRFQEAYQKFRYGSPRLGAHPREGIGRRAL